MRAVFSYYIFYGLVLSLGLLFIVFQITHSYFTSSASSLNNIFTTATSFPSCVSCEVSPSPSTSASATPIPSVIPTPGPGDIVINEVSPLGDQNVEWVELFNKTNNPIDVSGWKIADSVGFPNGNDDVFPNVPVIPAGGYAIVVGSNSLVSNIPTSAIKIELLNSNIGSGLNNTGGDAVIVKNSSNIIIDAMNYGNVTVIFPSPPLIPTSGKSLSRQPNGQDTDTTSDWVSNLLPSIGVVNP